MRGIVPQIETAAKTDAGDNRKLVLKDDFVINSRSDRKGSSGVSPYEGSVSLISIVLEPKRILPAYAHHLLRSYPFQEEFYRFGKGIVADLWSTNSSEMKNILIPEVPLGEQHQIANFLDHETAKIDTLIEKQQQLIALLGEKRQAVISHAVTKGLNPDAPMKDSGVEWLGEVPEHWETGSLRWYIKIASGEGLSNTNFEQSKDNNCIYPVVGGNGVFGFSPYFNTSTPALAIGRVGALCGNVHLINEKCWITDNALKLSYWKAFYSKFLHLLIYAARLNEFASTTAQPLITGEQVKALHVVIPPIPEQQQISNFVDHETAKIDTLIEKQQQAIALMQERRTALISAAVTGKIDVRNWQPPTDKDIQ
jgi:type I restriction enzyme S subunit